MRDQRDSVGERLPHDGPVLAIQDATAFGLDDPSRDALGWDLRQTLAKFDPEPLQDHGLRSPPKLLVSEEGGGTPYSVP